MADLTPYQRDVLIRTALGEARGQGVEGMADVLQVVLNRANSGRYPSDPAKVALQPSQFSTWNTGEGGNNPQQFSAKSDIYKKAEQALDAVLMGRPDPTGGALFYHTPGVKPGWRNAVNTNGTIARNGHVFYPSHPVPPGDIPTVATLLSTARNPPAPVTSSPDLRMMRGATMPSQLINDTFSSLPQLAPKRFTGAADLKLQAPNISTPRLNPNGTVLNPADYVFGKDLDYASAGRLPSLPQSINAPRSTQQMAEIYAGGGPTRPVAPMPASVPAIPPIAKPAMRTTLPPARLPTLAPAPAPKPRAPTPSPAPLSNDMRMMRSANNILPRSNAPAPATQSIQMASTRVAPSSPQTQQAAEQAAQRMRTAAVPAPSRPPVVPASLPRVDVGLQEALLRQQSTKYPERLPSEIIPVGQSMPAIVNDPRISVAQTTGQVNPQGLKVATVLDTRQMPPLPQARPPMGIGGPVATPQQIAGARIAPVPMPRLERPGIFGNPKIGNFKVPLPGMLGHLQDFTAAMNNASGPFNNGADNLLYSTMRGGDFNAPGAATGQAGGFLFAPNPNGGAPINVGRVDPSISAADDYARRNAGNSGPSNAASRAKKNSTSNYGGAEPITGY